MKNKNFKIGICVFLVMFFVLLMFEIPTSTEENDKETKETEITKIEDNEENTNEAEDNEEKVYKLKVGKYVSKIDYSTVIFTIKKDNKGSIFIENSKGKFTENFYFIQDKNKVDFYYSSDDEFMYNCTMNKKGFKCSDRTFKYEG